ncbi:MAG TPA: 50S ribosomal protein L11 methyltransferase, partial [Solirubrobacteraceae bacterium]|nr:50S ribosomal protein L11 methyltransferase [Solirubrobacteraceae bacterium]
GEGMVEYAVYGAPGELPLLPDVRAAAGGALVEISTSEVADDWSERWKQFHRPVMIEARAEEPAPRARGGHCLFVRPPWEAPSERANALDIVIDPAQAFGTGAHATTRLCLELLLELAADEGVRAPVLDVGSGSGVLAIAALKLGYRKVLALDNDRESIRAMLANAAVNDVKLEARCFDLRRESLPWLAGDEDLNGVPVVLNAPTTTAGPKRDTGQVVLANLLRPLLIDLAEKVAQSEVSTPPSRLDLIASGLLREQADEVAEVFAKRLGLSERARREQGEWSALWLERSRAAP